MMLDKKIKQIDFLRFFLGGSDGRSVEFVIDKGSIYISEYFGYFKEIFQNADQKLLGSHHEVLIKTLEDIGVNNWKQNYINDAVIQGTEWELEIRINDEKNHYCFAGYEEYPSHIGSSLTSVYTEEFKKLLRALNSVARKSFFCEIS